MTQLTTLPVTTKKASDASSKLVTGSGISFTKTSAGVFTLLPAVAYDRLVGVYGVVTEKFDSGTGTETDCKVGQGDDDDKFVPSMATGISAALGDPGLDGDDPPAGFAPWGDSGNSFATLGLGILSANQPLIATVTAAVGDGAGGAAVAAIAIAAITPA